MDVSAATLWWVIAGLLVAVELASGTFYLLMLSLGAVAGALSAHAGAGLTTQIVVAALTGGGATAAWHFKRASSPRSAPAESNADVLLDIGQTLQVDAWGADGSARVPYRGAAWSVRFVGPGAPAPGLHRIVSVHGSQLSVTPASPS
ncbi:MAG: NfeD family protein [Rubrivivax sp.]|nr:NfeD family protein [Rubrivivax sp.]